MAPTNITAEMVVPVRSTNKEPGQDGQFDDCTKDVLGELCEDDYSDAKEEFQANLDTD